MKDYLKSKVEKFGIKGKLDTYQYRAPGYSFTIFGVGEAMGFVSRMADSLSNGINVLFDDLDPSQSSITKSSIQAISTVDLLSEGPIEGFVDQLGNPTSDVLEATYFDDALVKTSKKTLNQLESSILNVNPSLPTLKYFYTAGEIAEAVGEEVTVVQEVVRQVYDDFWDYELTPEDKFVRISNFNIKHFGNRFFGWSTLGTVRVHFGGISNSSFTNVKAQAPYNPYNHGTTDYYTSFTTSVVRDFNLDKQSLGLESNRVVEQRNVEQILKEGTISGASFLTGVLNNEDAFGSQGWKSALTGTHHLDLADDLYISGAIDQVSGRVNQLYGSKRKLRDTSVSLCLPEDNSSYGDGRRGAEINLEYDLNTNSAAATSAVGYSMLETRFAKADMWSFITPDGPQGVSLALDINGQEFKNTVLENDGFQLSALLGFNTVGSRSLLIAGKTTGGFYNPWTNKYYELNDNQVWTQLRNRGRPKVAFQNPEDDDYTYGYTSPLYLTINVYAQDRWLNANSFEDAYNKLVAGTQNTVTVSRPRKFQGNVIYGLGLDKIGRLSSVWSARTFSRIIFGPFEFLPPQFNGNYNTITDKVREYLARGSFRGETDNPNSWEKDGDNFTNYGDKPAVFEYSILPGTNNPTGLKEPILERFSGIAESVKNDTENYEADNMGFLVFRGNLFNWGQGYVESLLNAPDTNQTLTNYEFYVGNNSIDPLPGKRLLYATQGIEYLSENSRKIDMIINRQHLGVTDTPLTDNFIDAHYSSFLGPNGKMLRYAYDARAQRGDYAALFDPGEYQSYTERGVYVFQDPDIIPFTHTIGLRPTSRGEFYGGLLWPVYLGENSTPTLDNQTKMDLNKIMIPEDYNGGTEQEPDDELFKALHSGYLGNYDVFIFGINGIKYGHAANPNANLATDLMSGQYITIKAETQQENEKHVNIKEVFADYRLGAENQSKIHTDSTRIIQINKALIGPFNGFQDSNDTLVDSTSPVLDGRLANSAFEGTSSRDIRDNVDFSDYFNQRTVEYDAYPATHRIEDKEVNSIVLTFNIDSLSRSYVEETAPDRFTKAENSDRITVSIEIGFEGIENSSTTYIKHFDGLVLAPYMVDTEEYLLPTYESQVSKFSNPTLTPSQIAQKHKRYVKVTKTTFETESVLISRSISLTTIKEIIKCNFSYPGSAVVRCDFNARNVTRIPTRTFLTRLKRILVPSNYFPLDRNGRDKRFLNQNDILANNFQNIYSGSWDGTFKEAWSDNPAWILYDLMTNQNYGIGSRLDDLEDIDIWNLYDIGRYCDAVDENGNFSGLSDLKGGLEPRFSCNILIDGQNNPYNVLNDVASSFNGRAFYQNDSINFFCDKPEEISAFYNGGNVYDGYFDYETTSKDSNFNHVMVEFQDKDDDYLRAVESIENEDSIRENGLIHYSISAKGATSRAQARRAGKQLLYSNLFEREIVRFKTGPQSLLCTVGDVIKINDPMRSYETEDAKCLFVQHLAGTSIVQVSLNSVNGGSFILSNSSNASLNGTYNYVSATEYKQAGAITYPRFRLVNDSWQFEYSETTSSTPGGSFVVYGSSAGYNGTYEFNDSFTTAPFVRWVKANDNLVKYFYYDESVSLWKFHYFGNEVSSYDSPSATNVWEAKWTSFPRNFNYDLADVTDGSSTNLNIVSQSNYASQVGFKETYPWRATYSSVLSSASFNTTSITFTTVIEDQEVVDEGARSLNVTIENVLDNTGVLQTGDEGGLLLYLYNQNLSGKNDLYNATKLDNLSITNHTLDQYNEPDVYKFKPNGVTSLSSDNKHLTIGLTIDDSTPSLSGISGNIGGQIAFETTTSREYLYRVLSISPDSDSLYNVTATQYDPNKYKIIESEDSTIDYTEKKLELPNIGAPTHKIKSITEPADIDLNLVTLDSGATNLEITIKGLFSGNEEYYAVTVLLPNGTKQQTIVEKSSTKSGGFFVTNVTIRGLYIYGDYNVLVYSTIKD